MRSYFYIQYQMLNRRLREFGVHPILGYIGGLTIYIFGSYYLFEITELAAYIYAFMALLFVSRASEADRNDFLKNTYSAKEFHRVRLLENGIVASPFLIFLFYQQAFSVFAVVALIAAIMALLKIRTSSSRSVPTPFSKRPFEFSVGFRRTWPILLLVAFLTYMAIISPNFGIGILALLLIFFTSASNYLEPEPEYYVWIFARTPGQFLSYKIISGLYQMTLLCLPVIIALSIFFWKDAIVFVPIMIIFWMYLATLIYAKYASYPDEMNIPQGLLYTFSMAFPPMLLFAAPYFYRRSNDKLTKLLK